MFYLLYQDEGSTDDNRNLMVLYTFPTYEAMLKTATNVVNVSGRIRPRATPIDSVVQCDGEGHVLREWHK